MPKLFLRFSMERENSMPVPAGEQISTVESVEVEVGRVRFSKPICLTNVLAGIAYVCVANCPSLSLYWYEK